MRTERKNAVRQTIIDTASQLFYSQGYGHTGINQIIEKSGVVKSTLYSTFRSKEDILMEYLISAGAATDAALLSAANKYNNPKDQVLGVFDFLVNYVQEKDYNGCNFLNIISEIPKESSRVIAQIKQQKNGVRSLFRKLLSPLKKEELADQIYILFEGALIGNKVHGAIWPISSARKTVDLLLS